MEVVLSEQVIDTLDWFERKHKLFAIALHKKMQQITCDPLHFKPLRNELKGYRRAHIGHYVIIYKIENNRLFFEAIMHHDNAY